MPFADISLENAKYLELFDEVNDKEALEILEQMEEDGDCLYDVKIDDLTEYKSHVCKTSFRFELGVLDVEVVKEYHCTSGMAKTMYQIWEDARREWTCDRCGEEEVCTEEEMFDAGWNDGLCPDCLKQKEEEKRKKKNRKLIIVEAFPAVFQVDTVYPECRLGNGTVPFWKLISMTKHYGTFELAAIWHTNYDHKDGGEFEIPEPVKKRMKITHGHYWRTVGLGKHEITDIPEDTVFSKRGEIHANKPATKGELVGIMIAELSHVKNLINGELAKIK